MKNSRRFRSLSVALFVIMAMLGSVFTTRADAAEITDAVLDITVTTTGEVSFYGGTVGFDMDWCVPDGSSAGDYFTLTLPPELTVPNGFTFDLPDSSGNVVAVATANNGVLTFTLTSFVEGRNNVCGTAFMEARVDQSAATPGETNDLLFMSASDTFAGSIDVGPVGSAPTGNRKFTFTPSEPTPEGNELTSGIETRVLTAADVGLTITITDTPQAGIELDCSTTRVSVRNAGAVVSNLSSPGDYTETCSPTGSTITLVVTPAMVDNQIRAVWDLNVTDDSVPSFDNEGTISIGDETTAVAASEDNLAGGGTGSGDNFDLALFKQLDDGTNLGTVAPGDTVTFTLTVENQGNVDAADIELVDYLPAGLTLADSGWTDNGDGTATINTPIAALAAGDATTVDITFMVDADASGTIDNWAEIADATDGDGNPVTDIDSTPDTANDDQFITDDEVGESGLDGGDEDDHDRAQLNIEDVFDLALVKQLDDGTNLATVAPGDTVTFTITVTNQGNVDATIVEVVDYVPAGLTLADADWTDNGDGTATRNMPLLAVPVGGSVPVDITFTVDADATGQIDNWAEIASANDTEGNPGADIDSTPDTNPADDTQPTGPNDVTDDEIDESGLAGGDEDDHDVAGITVAPPAGTFDLALTKQLADGTNLGSFDPGAGVMFTITVENQGTIDATNIAVVDYVPAGLTLADANWTDNADGTATLNTPIASLAAGASTSVNITFTVDADATGQIDNWAEIASAADAAGDPATDVDSTPNTDPDDDNQPSGPNDTTDDETSENGLAGGDEDDHDVAGITVTPPAGTFDLALVKQLPLGVNLGTVDPGDTVTFAITVENQGTIDATNIAVVDYLPAGLTLADAAWTDNADGTATLNTPIASLAVGASVTVNITFTVDPDATGQIDNWAEIAGASDDAGDPATDVDSTPNTDPDDDNQPSGPNDTTDDETSENGLAGGDEDDHDVAGVTVGEPQTYSLGNQVWLDDNNNGIIDPGEAPIEGVWIELFTDNDGDGLPDDTNADGIIDVDDAVATTGTDADGNYLFTGIDPGNYIVGIPPMEWDKDGPLYGTLSSDPTSTDPNDDIDNDDNGTPGPHGYVWSGPVTIGDGEPTGEVNDNDPNTPDANENLTIDFGFHRPTFDLALFKQLADGTNLASVNPGQALTFTMQIVNQGDIDAANLTIVDYLPTGLTLNDPDWTNNGDGTATINIAGPIAAGATATVDITFTVNTDAKGTIDNYGEIAAADPVDVLGKVVTMPNGEPLPDVDSIADANNTDTLTTDDSVTGNGITGGDEDDHDQAQVTVNQPTPTPTPVPTTPKQPELAFSGASSLMLAGLALTFIMLGAAAMVVSRTRTRTAKD